MGIPDTSFVLFLLAFCPFFDKSFFSFFPSFLFFLVFLLTTAFAWMFFFLLGGIAIIQSLGGIKVTANISF